MAPLLREAAVLHCRGFLCLKNERDLAGADSLTPSDPCVHTPVPPLYGEAGEGEYHGKLDRFYSRLRHPLRAL